MTLLYKIDDKPHQSWLVSLYLGSSGSVCDTSSKMLVPEIDNIYGKFKSYFSFCSQIKHL